MVNFSDKYFEGQNLTQTWERPDFERGVSAKSAALYLESIGKNDLAKEIRIIQSLTDFPIKIVAAPPSTAAYVAPWDSKNIYYNLHTLGRNADHKHIIRHESIHLEHQSDWGSTQLPGFRDLPTYAQSCFAKTLGTTFSERELLEGLTEGKATDQTKYDPNCAYNLREVPIADRFDTLVKNRSALSGNDFSTSKSFGEMGQSGSKENFKNGVIFTANQLMLEDAAASMGVKVDDAMATQMASITADLLRKGKLIGSQEEAKNILKTSPVYTLQVISKTKNALQTIGVPVDEAPPIKKEKPEAAANIFGEVLEKDEKGEGYKAVQKETADRAIGLVAMTTFV